jgi:hypothetical protein
MSQETFIHIVQTQNEPSYMNRKHQTLKHCVLNKSFHSPVSFSFITRKIYTRFRSTFSRSESGSGKDRLTFNSAQFLLYLATCRTFLFLVDFCTTQHYVTSRTEYWTGDDPEKRRQWPNRRNILAFMWRYWGISQETSVMIFGVLTSPWSPLSVHSCSYAVL